MEDKERREMKRFVFISILLLLAGFVFAQQNPEVGATDPESIGIDAAQQQLKEISVDRFENDGYWRMSMSPDEGFVTSRLFEGSPAEKEPIPDEEGMEIPDQYVLGGRIDFIRRGHSSFLVYPMRPIPIEGITKTISVWVAGRNFNHELRIMIKDYFGRDYELFMGSLNFQGWKKLTVAIPPQPLDGSAGIVQRNFNYNSHMGISVTGFKILCDPMESMGNFYIYFDDLRAVTDLFAESDRDADDMVDSW
jgi:hypothetical protein